jgi:hypothetical protein
MLSTPSSDKAALFTVSVVKRVSLLHVLRIFFPQWLNRLSVELVGVVLMTLGNGLAFKVLIVS